MITKKIQKPLLIGSAFCWGLLGFKRGCAKYDHLYSQPCLKELFLYRNKISTGIIGSLLYINPILLLPILYKEIYRFEVYLRNMDKEYDKDSYYDLF